jgi:hypothetical protein
MAMTNWKRLATTGMLALGMLGAPLAEARDRCDRPSYSRYESRGYGRSYAPAYTGSAYRDSGYYGNRNYGNRSYGYSGYRDERSAGKSAAIIGGSAAAGAVIGGLAGGGKGAAVGAVAGGIGGLIVDRTTRDRDRDRYGRRW